MPAVIRPVVLLAALVLGNAYPPARAADVESAPPLRFAQAWRQILDRNPELAAASLATDAAAARARQVAAWPNPELAAEAENFAGSGTVGGWDAAETTVRLSQQIPAAGRRNAQSAEARAATALVEADADTRRLELWRDAVRTFAGCLAARERTELAADSLRVAGEVQRAVAARARAGRVAAPEATRAGAEVALCAAALDRARGAETAAGLRLAALLGGGAPPARLLGRLDAVADLPAAGREPPEAQPQPAVARAARTLALRRAALAAERTAARPDVTVAAGWRRFEESGDHALVAEVSVPLPLFDRNRAGIRSAGHEVAAAERLHEAALLRGHTELAVLRAETEAGRAELLTLRERALPAAREAFDAARTGYEQGKFAYLQVLDAERALVEVRTRQLDALVRQAELLAEYGALSGRPDPADPFAPGTGNTHHPTPDGATDPSVQSAIPE